MLSRLRLCSALLLLLPLVHADVFRTGYTNNTWDAVNKEYQEADERIVLFMQDSASRVQQFLVELREAQFESDQLTRDLFHTLADKGRMLKLAHEASRVQAQLERTQSWLKRIGAVTQVKPNRELFDRYFGHREFPPGCGNHAQWGSAARDALRLVASTRMTTDLTGERGIVGWANLTAEQYDDIDAFYNRTRDACEQRFDSPEDVIADVVHNCTFMVMARITHFATPHWILGVVDYVRNSLALVRNRLVFNLVSLIIDPLVFLFGMLAPCYILVVNVMISSSLVLPRVNKNAIRLAWFLLAALAVRRDRRHLLWTAFIFLSLLDTLQLKAERRLGYCLFQ